LSAIVVIASQLINPSPLKQCGVALFSWILKVIIPSFAKRDKKQTMNDHRQTG
jgi:hypothetical protein